MAPLVAEVRVEEGVVPVAHRGEAAGETLRPRPAHTRLHHHGLADICSTFNRENILQFFFVFSLRITYFMYLIYSVYLRE